MRKIYNKIRTSHLINNNIKNYITENTTKWTTISYVNKPIKNQEKRFDKTIYINDIKPTADSQIL